jgi:hypothetical protein
VRRSASRAVDDRAVDLRGRWRAIAPLLVVGLALAACGDDDDDGAQAAASSDSGGTDVCAARDELAASLDALDELAVVEDGTNALDDALAAVDEALEALGGAVRQDLSDEVDGVQAAFDDLQTAVAGLDEQPSAGDAVASVSAAVTDLAEAAGVLGDELVRDCDEASGS